MKPITAAMVLLLILGTIVAIAVGVMIGDPEDVVAVHWATGHLTRATLLTDMADEFNNAKHKTSDGKLMKVEVVNYPSSMQAKELLARATTGIRSPGECCPASDTPHPDPTIVTPSSAHWLVQVNHAAGRVVVDIAGSDSIAQAMIGIVTYREMAECLGWPGKEIGYADIIELRADPLGWSKYPLCAKAEWGQRPLVAFTNPKESSTGRSVLLSLYSIAAGKPPEQLTRNDVTDPAVVTYVKDFQNLIDHYTFGTTALNTKIYQGPQYGHFFLMPEDNLIHLKDGTENFFDPHTWEKVEAPRLARPMVMIYPKEGSMPRNNCACIVQADWVSEEQIETAERWISYIREDEQQRAFMQAGFRPSGSISLNDPSSKINSNYGLEPKTPNIVIQPSLIDPAVAATIDDSWDQIKRPAIVTLVVDTSGSMQGGKIEEAKAGLVSLLDTMAKNTQVGFVTFDDTVNDAIPVGALTENAFQIADLVRGLRTGGQTALYDAIKAGIEMTDAAKGPTEATRAVVVLTDGEANQGQTGLDDLIHMISLPHEVPIDIFRGMMGQGAEVGETVAIDERGNHVEKKNVVGTGLAIKTRNPIQIFFIGIGEADKEIGRLLVEATGGEPHGATEDDLAEVIEELWIYF